MIPFFFNSINRDVKPLILNYEQIHNKRSKVLVLLNQTCLKEKMLPIYIYIHMHALVSNCLCVCVCVCVCVLFLSILPFVFEKVSFYFSITNYEN